MGINSLISGLGDVEDRVLASHGDHQQGPEKERSPSKQAGIQFPIPARELKFSKPEPETRPTWQHLEKG